MVKYTFLPLLIVGVAIGLTVRENAALIGSEIRSNHGHHLGRSEMARTQSEIGRGTSQ